MTDAQPKVYMRFTVVSLIMFLSGLGWENLVFVFAGFCSFTSWTQLDFDGINLVDHCPNMVREIWKEAPYPETASPEQIIMGSKGPPPVIHNNNHLIMFIYKCIFAC